jgi:hypothetical protein
MLHFHCLVVPVGLARLWIPAFAGMTMKAKAAGMGRSSENRCKLFNSYNRCFRVGVGIGIGIDIATLVEGLAPPRSIPTPIPTPTPRLPVQWHPFSFSCCSSPWWHGKHGNDPLANARGWLRHGLSGTDLIFIRLMCQPRWPEGFQFKIPRCGEQQPITIRSLCATPQLFTQFIAADRRPAGTGQPCGFGL